MIAIALSLLVLSADDTESLQQLVSKGGNIVLENRPYRITKTIVVDLAASGITAITGNGTARIFMAGSGPAFRFVGTHEGTADPKSVKDTVWQKERSPMLGGLEIVGEHAEADGVEADGTMQLMLSRLVVRKCRHAVHLVRRNRNIIVSNCNLYENHGIGIYYDRVNLHQSNIVGSHISYNAGGGVVVRGGDVRNIHIGTCDIEGNQKENSPPTANVLFDCTEGQMGEVAISGCTIQHGRRPQGSANIRMIGQSTLKRPKTEEMREGHVTITGNVFSDVAINVHLQKVRGVVLTGNTFWQSFQHALLVEDSAHVTLAGNNFDSNPRYDDRDITKERTGLVFRKCNGCTLSGNHIASVRGTQAGPPAALLLEDCQRINITGCSVLDCDNVGVLLKGCSKCRVSDCLIDDERSPPRMNAAIRDEGGKRNKLNVD